MYPSSLGADLSESSKVAGELEQPATRMDATVLRGIWSTSIQI